MKADVAQQRSLLELADLDAELGRLKHRMAHLPEQQRHDELETRRRAVADRLAAAAIALEDVDAQMAKLESEVDAVRQREDRDRGLLNSGNISDPRQLGELQHELGTLERRRANLEDSLLAVMERREELASDQAGEQADLDGLEGELVVARQDCDEVLAELARIREERSAHRAVIVAGLDGALLELYERQRGSSGIGAGRLMGHRCGACRIELDRGEVSRISAAAEDEVLRCPECRAILLRLNSSGE